MIILVNLVNQMKDGMDHNVSARVDSIKLMECAEFVISTQLTMVVTAYVTMDSMEMLINVKNVMHHVEDVMVLEPGNV